MSQRMASQRVASQRVAKNERRSFLALARAYLFPPAKAGALGPVVALARAAGATQRLTFTRAHALRAGSWVMPAGGARGGAAGLGQEAAR